MVLFGDKVRRGKNILNEILFGFFLGKFLPVAFGVKKLQIGCVVEDDKVKNINPSLFNHQISSFQVGTDFLEEKICEFEDYVQSVDVVSFNKI